MTDTTDPLTYWKGRLEHVIGLDDGDVNGAMKDRFLEERQMARAALNAEDHDALDDWLFARHPGYLLAVRVWADRFMAQVEKRAEELEGEKGSATNG